MQENSYDCCDSDLSESPVQVQDQDSQVEGQGQGELENNLSCRVDLQVHSCAVWPPIVFVTSCYGFVKLPYVCCCLAIWLSVSNKTAVVTWSYGCDYGYRQHAVLAYPIVALSYARSYCLTIHTEHLGLSYLIVWLWLWFCERRQFAAWLPSTCRMVAVDLPDSYLALSLLRWGNLDVFKGKWIFIWEGINWQ